CRCRLGRQYRRITPFRTNDPHMAANEFCPQCGNPIVVTVRPPALDRAVLAFDLPAFLQTLPECATKVRLRSGRSAMRITDHWNDRLLRTRHQRPSRRRAAEQRDELATLHSITSSARKRIDVGNTIPKPFAVFRLMTSSNVVGNSAGSSAGLAPRSTLAT